MTVIEASDRFKPFDLKGLTLTLAEISVQAVCMRVTQKNRRITEILSALPEPKVSDKSLTPDQALDSLLWCIALHYNTPENPTRIELWSIKQPNLEVFSDVIDGVLNEVETRANKKRVGDYFVEIGDMIATFRLGFSAAEIVGFLEKEPIFKSLILTPTPTVSPTQ